MQNDSIIKVEQHYLSTEAMKTGPIKNETFILTNI